MTLRDIQRARVLPALFVIPIFYPCRALPGTVGTAGDSAWRADAGQSGAQSGSEPGAGKTRRDHRERMREWKKKHADLLRKLDLTQAGARPFHDAGERAMDEGRYRDAQASFAVEKRLLAEVDLHPVDGTDADEMECNFQLGDYRKALEEASSILARNPDDPWVAGAAGISLLHLGRCDEAQKVYSPDLLMHYPGGQYSTFLPGTDSPDRLEATFRIARGLSRKTCMDFEHSLPEFEAADRLVPDNPLIAYFKGESLCYMGRTAEAVKCIALARRLGGTLASLAERNFPRPSPLPPYLHRGTEKP